MAGAVISEARCPFWPWHPPLPELGTMIEESRALTLYNAPMFSFLIAIALTVLAFNFIKTASRISRSKIEKRNA
jgi:ABC-type dipeptide/oligopeptide/nickel transport system permease subunit